MNANTKPIEITQNDYNRLTKLLEELERTNSGDAATRQALSRELSRAVIRSSEEIGPDVITLHSRACVRDLDTGEEMTWTLSLPHEASVELGNISVLAPVGMAMLGCHKGDVFEWEIPSGKCRYEVVDILFQPEADAKMKM